MYFDFRAIRHLAMAPRLLAGICEEAGMESTEFETGAAIFDESLQEEKDDISDNTEQLFEKYEMYLRDNATESEEEEDTFDELDIGPTLLANRRRSRFSFLKEQIQEIKFQPIDLEQLLPEKESQMIDEVDHSKLTLKQVSEYIDELMTGIDNKTIEIQENLTETLKTDLTKLDDVIASAVNSAVETKRVDTSLPPEKSSKVIQYANVIQKKIESINRKIQKAKELMEVE